MAAVSHNVMSPSRRPGTSPNGCTASISVVCGAQLCIVQATAFSASAMRAVRV